MPQAMKCGRLGRTAAYPAARPLPDFSEDPLSHIHRVAFCAADSRKFAPQTVATEPQNMAVVACKSARFDARMHTKKAVLRIADSQTRPNSTAVASTLEQRMIRPFAVVLLVFTVLPVLGDCGAPKAG